VCQSIRVDDRRATEQRARKARESVPSRQLQDILHHLRVALDEVSAGVADEVHAGDGVLILPFLLTTFFHCGGGNR